MDKMSKVENGFVIEFQELKKFKYAIDGKDKKDAYNKFMTEYYYSMRDVSNDQNCRQLGCKFELTDMYEMLSKDNLKTYCKQCEYDNPKDTLVFCERCGFPLDFDIEYETFKGLPNVVDRKIKKKMVIDKRSEESIYITIGDYTYYIDDSTDEQIIDKWKNNDNTRIIN